MASDKYLILLCTFSCLCCVICDLNLSEDPLCITEGLNGTRVGINKCPSASLSLMRGFDPEFLRYSEFLTSVPLIKDNEPVICHTDCNIKPYQDYIIGSRGSIIKKQDQVAKTKCIENFQRLPYPCYGSGNIQIKKIWKGELKCRETYPVRALTVGRRDAQRWEFPHSALIGFGKDVESAQWLCGGSVISEQFILTAAHCSSTRELSNISFAALGLLKRTDPTEYWKIHKIKRIIIHPKYKSPSKYHDIALLETETDYIISSLTPVDLFRSDSYLSPIDITCNVKLKISFGRDLLPACLDTLQSDKFSAEASGWGRLGNGKLADTLQVINLFEYDETECASIYQPHRHLKHGYDHEKQMCYGNHDEAVDTCEGDSGGPLQTNDEKCLYTIVGVTSYGKDCGILGSAGMYTRVSYYVPWIESIVWPEETEAQRKKDDQWLDKLFNYTVNLKSGTK